MAVAIGLRDDYDTVPAREARRRRSAGSGSRSSALGIAFQRPRPPDAAAAGMLNVRPACMAMANAN